MLSRLAVDDSAHFRSRARQCRSLAESARDEASRRELNDMAEELDAEADRIDGEDPDMKLTNPPSSS